MSSTNKRGIIQLIVLIIVLTVGFIVNGWAGLFIGFGIFAISIVLGTWIRMRRISREVEAEQVAIETKKSGNARVPQDYKRKKNSPLKT